VAAAAAVEVEAGTEAVAYALGFLEVFLADLEHLELCGCQAGQRIAGGRRPRAHAGICGTEGTLCACDHGLTEHQERENREPDPHLDLEPVRHD
jgi:hypothetical protein